MCLSHVPRYLAAARRLSPSSACTCELASFPSQLHGPRHAERHEDDLLRAPSVSRTVAVPPVSLPPNVQRLTPTLETTRAHTYLHTFAAPPVTLSDALFPFLPVSSLPYIFSHLSHSSPFAFGVFVHNSAQPTFLHGFVCLSQWSRPYC
jgi:hypothetical protein